MNYMYKICAAALLCGLALGTGCSGEPFSMARQLNLQPPSVADIGYSLVSAADNRIVADTTLTLHNPNNLSIDLSGLQAESYVNDLKVGDIIQSGIAKITAQGNSLLNLRVTAYTDQLWPAMADHISRGESSSLTLRGTAFIGSGWFSFPYPFTYTRNLKTDLLNHKKLDREKTLPLAGLAVSALSSHWGVVGPNSLQLIHDVKVVNRGKNAATLSSPGYTVFGNGIELAEGMVGNGGISITPGDNMVTVVNTIRTQNIAPWLASHLNNGEVTALALSFKPGSRVITPQVNQLLDGRVFKAEIRTNLAGELAHLKDSY